MSNPSGQPASFSRGALAHLQLALGTTLRSRQDDETALQSALERLCAEAHAMELGVDEMLVVLKALWLPVEAGSHLTEERKREVRDRVIAACVAAYFRGHRKGRPDA